MNKIEQIKATKGGLEVGRDIPRYAGLGFEAIEEGDLERLKWWGIFFRKHTPGYFMMRIRIPNGISSAAQLRTIGRIAGRVGRGIADITTRQQIQLRWIRIKDVPQILDELREVGLVTLQTGMDNIRNIVGCPVAGLTPNELFDASPVARSFTDVFVGDLAYTNLPRKFNVTITGCRENCSHAETQDLALVPATKAIGGETVPGFNVLAGGKNGSGGYRIATPLDIFVPATEAVDIARTVVFLFRDHGAREARNKARLAFLLDEWGEAKFRDALEGRLGRPLERAGRDERLLTTTDHIGVFRQKQPTLSYVGLSVAVGRITSDQLVEVARLAEVYGTGNIRLTVDQNVIIPHVPDARLGNLTAEPLLKVLRYDPSQIMRGLVSCTGIEFCNLAVIETKSRALQVARAVEAKIHHGRPIRMHWSGCPAGCGNHTVADIGLLGTKTSVDGKAVDAVDIFVGGSSGSQATHGIKLLESVPCQTLPKILEDLIRHMTPEKIRRQLRNLADLVPSPRPESASQPVVATDEVQEGTAKIVTVNGLEVAVFRYGSQLYALQNRCPHAGGSLGDGVVEGDEVICPLHAYRFNIRTGACSTDPALRAKPVGLVRRPGGVAVAI